MVKKKVIDWFLVVSASFVHVHCHEGGFARARACRDLCAHVHTSDGRACHARRACPPGRPSVDLTSRGHAHCPQRPRPPPLLCAAKKNIHQAVEGFL